MEVRGRSRELGALRSAMDGREPCVITVSGLPGAGVSSLLREAVRAYSALVFRCPPLPDPLIRGALHARLRRSPPQTGRAEREEPERGPAHGPPAGHDDTPPDWPELFHTALTHRDGPGPFVLVLDDAHRLPEGRSRVTSALTAALARVRDEGHTAHVVLAGRAGGLPDIDATEVGASFDRVSLRVGSLPLRAAVRYLPGRTAAEQLRAYGVFGGLPGVLTRLDRSVTVGTNVRRLLLHDAGALTEAPLTWLERSVQTPARYVALLESLAHGEVGWSPLSASVPDLTRSGQVAPYVQRLSELGFVGSRRSLDARPRSRSTRYHLADPFLAFWLRFVLPWRLSERTEEIVPYYARAIRPQIRDHLQRMMAGVCRSHMELDALETFGSSARDSGSIWNTSTDIPVAGTLTNGATYYGTCVWDPPAQRAREAPASPLDALDLAIRETRYGFGREHRLRVVFTGRSTPTWLRREVARRHDARLIGADDLVGGSP